MDLISEIERRYSNESLPPDLQKIIAAKTDSFQKISNAYESCKLYLDKNFIKEFVKPECYYSRLWELWICSKLLHTSRLRKNLGDGEPDFILNSNHEDAEVFFECVCPQVNEKYHFKDGDFCYSEEKSDEMTSTVSSGCDHYILSRLTNSLKEKGGKVSEYKNKHPNAFSVLCISGFLLAKFKSLNNEPSLYYLPVEREFHTAIYGDVHTDFHKDGDVSYSYKDRTVNKGKTKFNVSEVNLIMYDAIVFTDKDVFNTFSHPYHQIVYRKENSN